MKAYAHTEKWSRRRVGNGTEVGVEKMVPFLSSAFALGVLASELI